MNSSRKRYVAVATIILVAAASLRIILLQDIPPGLARDETLNADIASLIRQGNHALFFREGYGHEPLYHYLGALFQTLIGDNYLAIRLPSVYLGLILVASTITWVRREFDERIGLLTGALITVSWWPIIFSRVGLRPILAPLLLVGSALFWRKRPWLAGLLLGLATYSYTSARIFLVFPAIYAAYLLLIGHRSGFYRRQFRGTLVVWVISWLVYLPLAIILAADPTLQERLRQLSGPISALRAGDLAPLWQSSVATLGVFTFSGDPLWSYAVPGRSLFDAVVGVLFYTGIGLSLWRIRRRSIYGFVLIWLLLALLPSAAAPDAPSLIRLIGAIPVVYLLPSIAAVVVWEFIRLSLSKLTRQHPDSTWGSVVSRFPAEVFLILLMSLVVAVSFRQTFVSGFQEWPAAGEVRRKYQSIWLEISRDWREAPVGALVISDSWYEPVREDSLRRDLGEELPARWVQQGNALVFPPASPARLYVPEFAPPSTQLMAIAGLSQPEYRSDNSPSYAVFDLPSDPPTPLYGVRVIFQPSDQNRPIIALDGYSFVPDGDGSQVDLITYWEVLNQLPWDLTIFAHLVDADGDLIGQKDGLDAAPTSLQPGDRFLQLTTLDIPAEIEPVNIHLGLYKRQDGLRLIRDGDSEDRFIIEIPQVNSINE